MTVPALFVYGTGYWFGVGIVLAGLAATILVLGHLAYRARLARDLYADEVRALDGRDPRTEAATLVTEYARLSADIHAELRSGRDHLEGMRDAFEKGIKG